MITKEEIEALKANPATAALGEKLEKEQFIPKSRFDEINQKAKEAQAALDAKIEAEKKATESAALEQGKFKELLAERDKELLTEREKLAGIEKQRAELETKAKAFEESQQKLREKSLSAIKDADLRKIADKLPSVEDVVEFAEKVSSQKIKPYSDKPGGDLTPQFKNVRDWERHLQDTGKAN
jgi:chromosome segregation ATPase